MNKKEINAQFEKLLLLQLEFCKIEKIYSFYTNLLSFLAQYSFIFDESPTKTKPLTPDPARDGSNWYGYAGQNPLIHIDPTGLAYYTGPTGSSVQSTNTPVTKHEFMESQGPVCPVEKQKISDTSVLLNIISTNINLSGKASIDYGANYDQIMNDIQEIDFSNGIPADFLNTHNFISRFAKMRFNAENPLNQLVLDKALGLNTSSVNTKSCQTTSTLNAWAVNTENGITGQNILNVLGKNEDGTFGEGGFVDTDGSLLSIWGLGFNMGKELKLDSYITAGDNKIIPPNLLENLSVGAIVGVSKTMLDDNHFLFTNWTYTIDSMDHTRPSASEYKERSHRQLYWQTY